MRLSIIVPALNEADTLPALLDHLGAHGRDSEVLVVDGGSTDATPGIATAHACAPTVITSSRGRAAQMNAGAACATGDVFVFLHADSRLPRDAATQIGEALADDRVVGGNFALRFDGGDRFSRLLGRWYAFQRRTGIYYGDSTIWLRATTFRQLGGFREQAIMEDYELVRRLERTGRTVCLPGPATTSARRWQGHGLPRTIAGWVIIRWLYIAGVSPDRLARLYPHIR